MERVTFYNFEKYRYIYFKILKCHSFHLFLTIIFLVYYTVPYLLPFIIGFIEWEKVISSLVIIKMIINQSVSHALLNWWQKSVDNEYITYEEESARKTVFNIYHMGIRELHLHNVGLLARLKLQSLMV
jgi:hypothetical protein